MRLVGQKVVVAFRGSQWPPQSLLDDVRAGKVGGVILFKDNAPTRSASGFRQVTSELQAAARAGGNRPLLIATDQEGGPVQRLPGPPGRSAAEMSALSPAEIYRQGRDTGQLLCDAGINLDLAPVADTRGRDSFLGPRSFGSDPQAVADDSVNFARGLQAARVAATAKHYPGLGLATMNTDDAQTSVASSPAQLYPFEVHARSGTMAVMVSSAIYPGYDPRRPASFSPTVVKRLRDSGFTGVTITDDLTSAAMRGYGPQGAVLATKAGIDVLLYSRPGGREAARELLREVLAQRISLNTIREQVRRIEALKDFANRCNPAG